MRSAIISVDCITGDESLDEEISKMYIPDCFAEKFAELIVRECMLQCSKVENDDELSNYDGGFKDGAMLCYQQIQEHFGVEE